MVSYHGVLVFVSSLVLALSIIPKSQDNNEYFILKYVRTTIRTGTFIYDALGILKLHP